MKPQVLKKGDTLDINFDVGVTVVDARIEIDVHAVKEAVRLAAFRELEIQIRLKEKGIKPPAAKTRRMVY